ncbi:rhodopsin [Dirofilaria immitis]
MIIVSINYAQIVLHVHRKFSKRKARQSGICNNKHYPLSDPRHMREMTSSIIRLAIFHLICWLPFLFFCDDPC